MSVSACRRTLEHGFLNLFKSDLSRNLKHSWPFSNETIKKLKLLNNYKVHLFRSTSNIRFLLNFKFSSANYILLFLIVSTLKTI